MNRYGHQFTIHNWQLIEKIVKQVTIRDVNFNKYPDPALDKLVKATLTIIVYMGLNKEDRIIFSKISSLLPKSIIKIKQLDDFKVTRSLYLQCEYRMDVNKIDLLEYEELQSNYLDECIAYVRAQNKYVANLMFDPYVPLDAIRKKIFQKLHICILSSLPLANPWQIRFFITFYSTGYR